MISELDIGREPGISDDMEIRFNLDWAVTHEHNPVLAPDFSQLRRAAKTP